MDASAATGRLHEIVLAWDYFRLWDRQEGGLGVYDSLRPVPDTFEGIEVRRRAAGAAALRRRRSQQSVLRPPRSASLCCKLKPRLIQVTPQYPTSHNMHCTGVQVCV